jgi:hypothetical protein
MSDPRYPIGKYEPQPFSNELKEAWLADIKFLPQAIENAIANLDEHQLQTPYRDGGWTVHQRLSEFLKSLTDEDWQQKFVFHPEHNKEMSLWFLLGMYSWHSRHHVAHITSLREKKNW